MIDIIFNQCPLLSPVGETNAYLIIDPAQKLSVIVDPAGEPEKLQKMLDASEAVPVAILLTHAHYDHIAAMEIFQKKYRIPIYCGAADRDLLTFSETMLGRLGHSLTASADHWLNGGETLTFGGFSLQVISTPGHSKGSLCFYEPSRDTLISGDTLFYESIGRTDFPYAELQGSLPVLMDSLHKLFKMLPDSVKVLPGHGPTTTIGHERKYNAYLRQGQ